jgi:hypothetical protein
MITQLAPGKSVTRKTAAEIRERGTTRPIVVDLLPGHVELRLLGTRRKLSITHSALYHLLSDLEGKRLIRERKEQREARRRSKP